MKFIQSSGVIIHNKIAYQYQGDNRNLITETVMAAVLYFGAGAGGFLGLIGQFISTFVKKRPTPISHFVTLSNKKTQQTRKPPQS